MATSTEDRYEDDPDFPVENLTGFYKLRVEAVADVLATRRHVFTHEQYTDWNVPTYASAACVAYTKDPGRTEPTTEELAKLVIDAGLGMTEEESMREREKALLQLKSLTPIEMADPRPAELSIWGWPKKEPVIHAADQVIEISAGRSIFEANHALKKCGQMIPYIWGGELPFLFAAGQMSSIRDAIDFNLPHAWEGSCGSWKDWIRGATVMLADGRVVKSGSSVVKSVAGYDLHRLMVGARGTLGILVSVTLRTFPISAVPTPEIEVCYEVPSKDRWIEFKGGIPLWVQRTLPSDFPKAVRQARDVVLEIDWSTSTLWAGVEKNRSLPRYRGDWVLRSWCDEKNLEITDPILIALMKRAKEIFDPTHKLNPGEMGIF